MPENDKMHDDELIRLLLAMRLSQRYNRAVLTQAAERLKQALADKAEMEREIERLRTALAQGGDRAP